MREKGYGMRDEVRGSPRKLGLRIGAPSVTNTLDKKVVVAGASQFLKCTFGESKVLLKKC